MMEFLCCCSVYLKRGFLYDHVSMYVLKHDPLKLQSLTLPEQAFMINR